MAIEVSKLSFSYDGEEVLNNISFKIEDGDFVGILGSNGSGKTTLIKIILGSLKPSKGSVKIFGENIDHAIKHKHIGYVPQRYNIDKTFPASVKEILLLKGINNKIINTIGIGKLLDKKFSELSGGQQQRVLMALSLMSNPKLLILDEPTVGVDERGQKEFYSLLKKLNKQLKVTVIIVSHDIGLISKYVRNVIVLSRKICCFGKANEAEALLRKVHGEDFEAFHHRH